MARPLHNSFVIWHNAHIEKLTATLCLTIAVLLVSVGMSASADRPYWILKKVLSKHPDKALRKDKFMEMVHVEIAIPGIPKRYTAAMWVDLRLRQCRNLIMVNGVLTDREESGKDSAS